MVFPGVLYTEGKAYIRTRTYLFLGSLYSQNKPFCKLQTLELVSSSLASGGSVLFSYLGPCSVSFMLLVHGLSYMYSVRFTSAPCFSAHQLLSRGPGPASSLSMANRDQGLLIYPASFGIPGCSEDGKCEGLYEAYTLRSSCKQVITAFPTSGSRLEVVRGPESFLFRYFGAPGSKPWF